jgi:nucleoid-associated protein YgaU
MSLFSFIKEAGAKVFGIGKTIAEEKTEAVLEESARVKVQNERASQRLINLVGGLGLEVEDFCLSIDGEVATVLGKAKNQAIREKVILVIGNTIGISGVDDQMEVEIQEPVATFYTVVRGDTLSKIAKSMYGNAMKYPVIFEANKPMLTHPDKIYPGQVLRIAPMNS